MPFATDRTIVAILFDAPKLVLLQLFIMAGNELQTQLQMNQRPARSTTMPISRPNQQGQKRTSRKF
jgi:hypothetical protein